VALSVFFSSIILVTRAFDITSAPVASNRQQKTIREKLIQTNDIAQSLESFHHEPNKAFQKITDRDLISERLTPAPQKVDNSQLTPVILLPGDGGSRLQAKLNRTSVEHHYCERHSADWFDLWLNLSLLVPFAVDCWLDK